MKTKEMWEVADCGDPVCSLTDGSSSESVVTEGTGKSHYDVMSVGEEWSTRAYVRGTQVVLVTVEKILPKHTRITR